VTLGETDQKEQNRLVCHTDGWKVISVPLSLRLATVLVHVKLKRCIKLTLFCSTGCDGEWGHHFWWMRPSELQLTII